jgi:ABC-type multidrug transport system fused ATPase/permease subunit
MWEFFDNAPKMDLQKEKPDFQYKKWDIEIQNITFSYDEKNPVFTKFSLVFSWSQKIAFVWASWWGKTTLVKLISGFIKPQSGNILIDWQKLSEISLESYYQNIWYLTQEPSVFDGSIEDNLLYWAFWEVSQEQIKSAIQNAWCEFIYEFEHGLQTQIGERWVRLSGGQKQRLAIAKLFLKDPKIIILDEPTSALDSFSEEKITQSLHKLFSWRTVLIIAHRLQTVKDADEIVVFEWWEVIERGNHETLIAQNGYYKKMLDLQSGF